MLEEEEDALTPNLPKEEGVPELQVLGHQRVEGHTPTPLLQ